jgi:hypothetical protein
MDIASMEPMMPPEGEKGLEDLAFDVAVKAKELAVHLPIPIRRGIGDLVRSMNCYYSNLIGSSSGNFREVQEPEVLGVNIRIWRRCRKRE